MGIADVPEKVHIGGDILAKCKFIKIHPGIVAGRLQHDNIISQSRCAKLREKYEIVITD